MRNLVLLMLLMSFSIFAKVNIKYNFIPKNANVVGYVSTQDLMKNKLLKSAMKTKDATKGLKELRKMGIDITKIGSIFFYSNSDSIMKSKKNKDIKKAEFAIILTGVSFENMVKLKIKDNKSAKLITYNGVTIYKDFKIDKNNKNGIDAVAFINSNTVFGTLKGVKKVIKTHKSNSFNTSKKLINKISSTLNSPELLILNIINANQQKLINSMVEKNRTNPVLNMLGLTALSKSLKAFGVSVKLKGNSLKLSVIIKANKSNIKNFTTVLNSQFNAYKPMLGQQVNAYGGMIGSDAVKEIKSILNSIRIVSKGDLALISMKINIKNTIKIVKQLKNNKKVNRMIPKKNHR